MSKGIFFREILERFKALGYMANSKGKNSNNPKSMGLQAIHGVCHYQFVLKKKNIRLELSFGYGRKKRDPDSYYNERHYRYFCESKPKEIFGDEFIYSGPYKKDDPYLYHIVFGEREVDFNSPSDREEVIDWMTGRVHRMNRALWNCFIKLPPA